ncbi:MAG: F0F1 ATP synthase subunit epsilon [Dehalococcoidia bacterium]|nr:F0F1 ATP synthase subunit epsilon [Dehalococcoidia bacterium]MDD5494822.1 F0F1 ATP synthase subunit epsilon [Dehalococcoidia bacterium]
MPTVNLEIVTAERQVFSEDVTAVIAEGVSGQMTILPKHAPLITMLAPGELVIRKDGDEIYMAITGGFLEVRPDKVIVLADACERSDEIDLERAAEAKRRAEERLKNLTPEVDQTRAEAALRRSLARLRVVEKRRRAPGYRPSGTNPV